jgi:hypothetical protein
MMKTAIGKTKKNVSLQFIHLTIMKAAAKTTKTPPKRVSRRGLSGEAAEQQAKIREKYYREAVRYMDNAKETLKKAKKEYNRYQDRKYVKTACGTAYKGVLVALDGYCTLKGVKKTKSRKSIEYYQEFIGEQDRKMLDNLNSAYQILHLYGCYDDLKDARIVKRGFDVACTIIEKLKPSSVKL